MDPGLDEDELSCLLQQGFTNALAQAVWKNTREFPLRIWIVDNSGSMMVPDGKRLVETSSKNDVKLVSCSRWAELQECVKYHAHLALLLHAPTRFILLNDPGNGCLQDFGVAVAGSMDEEFRTLETTMSCVRPSGGTPLVRHVEEVYDTVSAMEPMLKHQGQRVAIVIATDGLPTNENGIFSQTESQRLRNALNRLGQLPVWIVVRLCTNDDSILKYYEELDSQLELSLEVLDDFCDEAKQVSSHNPWLNYALPLHRMREMGFSNRLLDLLDERPLTIEEMADLLKLVFLSSNNIKKDCDPIVDWDNFCKIVTEELEKCDLQWNPMKRKMTPWIDKHALQRQYGDTSKDSMPLVVKVLILWIVLGFVDSLVALFQEANEAYKTKHGWIMSLIAFSLVAFIFKSFEKANQGNKTKQN